MKDRDITGANSDAELGSFLRNRLRAPDATAIVVAASIDNPARAAITAAKVRSMTVEEMLVTARFWDLRKQRLAMRGLLYFLDRIEQKPALTERLLKFIKDEGLDLG